MKLSTLVQEFKVAYKYPVLFTQHIFNPDNDSLIDSVRGDGNSTTRKLLLVIDSGVVASHPDLLQQIRYYVSKYSDLLSLPCEPIVIAGGETCKNNPELITQIQQAINDYKIDRHSYMIAIGGGALIDMAGFAAAISHRGIRLIRIPTTVLAQNDSGIGVKNSINAFKKKNFLGTFAPPYAVINDFEFLKTLDERDWRAGIAEAIKVALIKDAAFFQFLKENVKGFVHREMEPMKYQIHRCAELHLNHIASGDPFEMGSSRPLDFGHWAAHKLEQLTDFKVRHGEAVAIGIALDCTYSYLLGMLTKEEWEQIISMLTDLGFEVFHTKLGNYADDLENSQSIFKGLSEFREHLGGKLTIMLLEGIGKGKEVHEVDYSLMKRAVQILEEKSKAA